MIIKSKEYLTLKEAADYLGISRGSLDFNIKIGLIEVLKLSPRRIFVPKDSLDNFKNGRQ